MRRDVHLAALKAATKVAFSMTLVGCASASPGGVASDEAASTTRPPAAGCHSGEESGADAAADASSGAAPDAGGTGDGSCDAVVAAAFPTPSEYPGTKQAVSAEVAACCDELLSTDQGVGGHAGEHRWDCCANAAHPENVGMACTPWGPPVPPAMRVRRAPEAIASRALRPSRRARRRALAREVA
jgi:hypothetical protein